jgi:hypothetical protein
VAERPINGPLFSEVVAVSAWLGAALFLAAVVAPAAFGALPTRTLAGALIGQVLPTLLVSGAILGLALLVIESLGVPKVHRIPRLAGAMLLASGCGVAQLWVAPRIASIRREAGVVLDSLAADNPLRSEFGRLHMLSVLWLAVAILGAAAVLVFAWLATRNRQDASQAT